MHTCVVSGSADTRTPAHWTSSSWLSSYPSALLISNVFCSQTATWRARHRHLTQMASTCWPARIAPVHVNSARYLWRGKMDSVLRGTELPYWHFLVSYTGIGKEGCIRRLWENVKWHCIGSANNWAVALNDIVFTALPTWHRSLGRLRIAEFSWNKTLTDGRHYTWRGPELLSLTSHSHIPCV